MSGAGRGGVRGASRRARRCLLLAPVVVGLLFVSVAWGQGSATSAADALRRWGEAYRIGPEDVLQIAVWRNEQLSRAVTVRPDGMISLPLVNDVRAAGLTPMELRETLARMLAELLPDPEVSVIVVAVHSFKVSVIGEVAKPSRYELKSRTTVLDVLAAAGGFTVQAARAEIVVLRHEGGAVRQIPFDYNKVTSRGGAAGNFYLQPGDIVVVP